MNELRHGDDHDDTAAFRPASGSGLTGCGKASERKQMMTVASHGTPSAGRFHAGQGCWPDEPARTGTIVFDGLDDLPCPADSDPRTWAKLPREIRAVILKARAAHERRLARRAEKGEALPFLRENEGLRVEGTPPGMSGAPRRLLQLPLFAVVAPGARRECRNERLPGPDGIELFYTGPQLDQLDLTCYMAVMNLYRARRCDGLCGVSLSLYMLLRELGQCNGKSSRLKALERLRRLGTGVITLVIGGQRWTGTLLNVYENEARGRLWVEPGREFQPFFLGAEWQRLEWNVRLALGRDQLALALWSYFRTFARPFPVKIATLRERVGSDARDLVHFRSRVKMVMTKVAATLAKEQGARFSWSVDANDCLCVEWDEGKKRQGS